MSQHHVRYWLAVPAAGAGRRLGGSTPKQYLALQQRTLLEWSLSPFLADPRCRGATVALAPEDDRGAVVLASLGATLPSSRSGAALRLRSVIGGMERADSVIAALTDLAGVAAPQDWVLVHDAARPCVTGAEIDALLGALDSLPEVGVGGLLAVPVSDTLKRAQDSPAGSQTVPREGLWRALTPQAFRLAPLLAALRAAGSAGRRPTDEAQAMEWVGDRAVLVPGLATNIKVTTPDDLALAAVILAARGSPDPYRAQAAQGA